MSAGIQETTALISAVDKLVLLFITNFAGGYDSTKLPAILQDLATDEDFLAAINGLSSLNGELSHLGFTEIMQVASQILGAVPGWVEATKSSPAK